MKVRDLIKKLHETSLDNEVRLISSDSSDGDDHTTASLYLSFDDEGDVLIYDE